MLSLVEKVQQSKYQKSGCKKYQLDIGVTDENQVITEETIELYAPDEEIAIEIGKRIQYRLTNKKRNNENTLMDWGFDLRDIKTNKLGLVLPWKNIVVKRSMQRATSLPISIFKSSAKELVKSLKGKNTFKKSELDRGSINKQIKISTYYQCSSTILFILGLYFVYEYLSSSTYPLNLLLSSIFLFVYSGFTFSQAWLLKSSLMSWRDSEDE